MDDAAQSRGWVLGLELDVGVQPIAMCAGETTGGLTELQSVTLVAPSADEWRLEIDDEVIDAEQVAGRQRWTWTPRFFAGEVMVRLIHLDSEREAEYRLDVGPDPKKLGRDVFRSMLQTLWTEAPELLIGHEPARHSRGVEDANEDPVLAYGRLRQFGPGFLRSLEIVAADPITRPRRERTRLPVQLIRRSDRRTALDLLRGGQLSDSVGRSRRVGASVPLFDAPIVEPTLDNSANRVMLAVVRAVLHRTRTCAAILESRSEREADDETRTSLRARWPARRAFLRRLELGLRRALTRPPLEDLHRVEVSPAGLNAVASHPAYARAHRLGRLCMRTGFAGESIADELWLPPTWEIYERWCWVVLRRQLEAAGFVETEAGAVRLGHEAVWRGVDRAGTLASLLFQARFPSWSASPENRGRSLSSELRPDLVLLLEAAGRVRFDVFDAKYRTTRSNVLDAMKSAHIYHDALRLDGRRPDRVTLLVPAGGGAPWLEQTSFQHDHGVGVQELAPGVDTPVLSRFP